MGQPPYASGPPPAPPPGHLSWPPPHLPTQVPAFPVAAPRGPQRPVVVAIASTLAVTASLQWIGALSFGWLVAFVATDGPPLTESGDPVEQLLVRVHDRMTDGLAWPLYLFALASFTTGFLVLVQRRWARWVHTSVGVAALGWSAWWLHEAWLWWLVPAGYIAVACAILWTPAASRWYRWPRR